MSTSVIRATRASRHQPRGGIVATLAYAVGGAAVLAVATRSGTPPSLALLVGGVAFVAVGIWFLCSERYEHTLAVLMIYLGIADGYLKLKTGSSAMTLARDALLYGIVVGAIIRWIVRREKAYLPPMGGWVLLFSGVVLAETVNPASGSLTHALASVRPHLEFVPLFFFGYAVMRSRARLYNFLLILVFICAANGVVSLIQFNESPAQLAAWGPGYAQKVNGTGSVAGRVFVDSSGHTHVRPFGLQSDAGGGGNTAILGLAAALALLGPLRRRWRTTAFVAVMSIGIVLAIVTSEGRGVVLAAAATLIAYIVLTVVTRRLVPTLMGVLVGGAVAFLVVSTISGGAASGAFSRYTTISPNKILGTEQQSRGFSLDKIPGYAVKYPLGAGLGATGPAAGVGAAPSGLDGETEFTFMLTDVGILGLAVLLYFHVRILAMCARIRKFADGELRALLAALGAPLFGILALYFGGAATSTSPLAPYLWFVSGTMVYWFTTGLANQRLRHVR